MKKVVFWCFASAIVMFLIPYLLTVFLSAGAGMMIYFVIFFYLNPIHSVLLGVSCGKRIKKMYYLPLVSAIMFVLGAWVFIDAYETAFLMYAGVYLALSVVSMLLSFIVYSIKKKK